MNTTNSSIKTYSNNIGLLEGNKNKDYYQKKLNYNEGRIKIAQENVEESKQEIAQYEKSKNKNAEDKRKLDENLREKEEYLQQKKDERKKLEDEMNAEVSKQDEGIKEEQTKISVLKGTMFRTKQNASTNYMDYSEIRFRFLKNQCNTIKNEAKIYYK